MFGWDVTMVLLDIVVIDVSYILNSNVADDFFYLKIQYFYGMPYNQKRMPSTSLYVFGEMHIAK